MRRYSLLLAVSVSMAALFAQADEQKTRAAQSDSRIVLGPGDRVTVTYQRSRNYRCAAGALVVQEWGSRVRLTCSDQFSISGKDRPAPTAAAIE